MSLLRRDFATFFAAMHNDHRPFSWQERLLDHVLDARAWPGTVDAPTGAGKTAVIDVHVFALALAAQVGGPLPPRRLSIVVGRRVLVDDQHQYATRLRDALREPEDPILAEMSRQLWRLRDLNGRRTREPIADESPLMTARLRGGQPPTRAWMDEPTAAAVLCATPDMWGSRLLFRGYGSSSRSWPRSAGLLAFDSVLVVDEAHLARQLLVTARRVGHLATLTEGKGAGREPLQVVETTATPAGPGDGTRIGVIDDDLEPGSPLTERLTRPKPVTLVPSAEWATTTPRSKAPSEIAKAVVGLIDSVAPDEVTTRPRTVGCFVNTVARAVAVTDELRNRASTGRPLTVVMICGQVRPHDVDLVRVQYPGLLASEGNAGVDVIVSTQSLEVGVDLDLAGVVSELAGASALVQRAGRVNRLGGRNAGPVTVIVPGAEIKDGQRSGPYEADELRDALAWIVRRADDPTGLAPWALRDDSAPPAPPRRPVFQRLELAEVDHFARTSDDLWADPELDLWLADDLTSVDDTSLGLVVRDRLPDDDGETAALLRALRPQRHEIFTVPFATGRDALAKVHDTLAGETGGLRAAVVRDDDVTPLTWTRRDDHRGWRPDDLRPGDRVVVDVSTPLFTAAAYGSPQVLIPAGDDTTRHQAPDVLEGRADVARRAGRPVGRGGVVHRIEFPSDAELAEDDDALPAEERERRDVLGRLRDDLEGLDVPADERADEERALVVAWLRENARSPMADAAVALLGDGLLVDVDVHHTGAGTPARVVIVDRRRAQADEDIRQEWAPRTGDRPPLLDCHQRAVAERVTDVANQLGLVDDLTLALETAARHHDDGKADRRFQARLGAPRDELWAKSDAATPSALRRSRNRDGLPPGWRHEQRSVREAWPGLDTYPDRDLVARLIGTTHGHGRPTFPHTASELLNDVEADRTARMLFDEGEWDELIERTHRRYGVWVCAYLEAVLRAADGQVSGEGR